MHLDPQVKSFIFSFSQEHSYHLRFTGPFPGEPGLAGRSPVVFFLHLLHGRESSVGISGMCFYRPRPSCHPTNSVKSLKGTYITDPRQLPGLILSSSIPMDSDRRNIAAFMPALQRQYQMSAIAMQHTLRGMVKAKSATSRYTA